MLMVYQVSELVLGFCPAELNQFGYYLFPVASDMRARSHDQYTTRYVTKYEGMTLSQVPTHQEEINIQPQTVERARDRKMTVRDNFRGQKSASLESQSSFRLSDRIISEQHLYGRLKDQFHDFELKLEQVKAAILKKKAYQDQKDMLRAKVRQERKQLMRTREKKRSLITMRTNLAQQSISLMEKFSNEKKPSFRLERLGGLVTTETEFQGRPSEKDPYTYRNNIYYISEVLNNLHNEDSLVLEHVRTSIQFLNILQHYKLPSVPHKFVNLAYRKGYQDKKTIIFDLDETLIHCVENLDIQHDIELPIIFPNGDVVPAGINIRPGVKELLSNLYGKCQVIVFTASHPCYANVVINYLDPEGKFIHHRLYRQDCHLIPQGPYVKDLRIINRDLSRTVLVDNAAYSYCFQVQNGIPIIPYYSGDNDFELKALIRYLQKVITANDVRNINRETFKLYKYKDYLPEEYAELVAQIYSTMKDSSKQFYMQLKGTAPSQAQALTP